MLSRPFRAVPGLDLFPWVETQAQSFNPFGIVRERFPNPRLQRQPIGFRFETNPQAFSISLIRLPATPLVELCPTSIQSSSFSQEKLPLPGSTLTGPKAPPSTLLLTLFRGNDAIRNLVLLAKAISFYYQFETKRNPSFSPGQGALTALSAREWISQTGNKPPEGLNRNFILRSIGAPPETQRNEIPKTRERSRSSCRRAHHGVRQHSCQSSAKGQNRCCHGSL
jgi:hypothetical protein